MKLNSVVEHRSASFMLRLQKGKVPQHQFVTESCGTELTPATEHRERKREDGSERGSVCVRVFVCVCGQVSVMSTVTSPPAPDNSVGGREGFASVV